MENSSITAYCPAANAIKLAILQGQYEAAKGANRVQLSLFYGIGKYISLNTRKGAWGTGALESISQILRRELPGLKGFSANSLKNMRKFYENWQMLDPNPTDEPKDLALLRAGKSKTQKSNSTSTIVDLENAENQTISNSTTAIVELQNYEIDIYHAIKIPDTIEFPVDDFFRIPFTHHVRIIEGTDIVAARYYYIHRTAEEKIPVRMLEKLIKDDAFGHSDTLPNNFTHTLSDADEARRAVMMFKDSYFLDFINTEQIGERDAMDVDERLVEQQIVQNIKNFIMTFGHDFTFVGNQYHLEVYGVEHFPDLLFFNRELNALVVVELKTGEFKTSYLGQLMGYLSILEAKVKKPHENPPIGIVLCKEANREYVEFVIRDYNKPMGVATYTTTTDMPAELRKTMPDIDELKRLL